MFKCSFIILVFFSTNGFGQLDYAKTILDSICHPRYDGRGYVNNGDNRAAEFIVRELKSIGVVPFKKREFSQHYQLRVNTFPGEVEVWLDEKKLITGADYLLNPNSGSVEGTFNIIEFNQFNIHTLVDERKFLSKGKDVMFAFNFTDIEDKAKRIEYRKMARIAMEFLPVIWVEKDKQMYGVGRSQQNYPLITIDSSAYFSANTATLKINHKYIPNYTSQNVIGMIPGKKRRKYIVLSAHFDHLGRLGEAYFPGANDNASGVAMLLSLAKYYSKHKPDYSIAFCFFSGEEAGLEGSKYFVQHPYFKLKKIKFVLNIDILGSASEGITVVNGTEHENEFNTLVKLNEKGNYLQLVKKRSGSANSDHYFFTQSGIPAFFIYSVGDVKNYHDIYDTAENTPLTNFDNVQSLLIDFIAQF